MVLLISPVAWDLGTVSQLALTRSASPEDRVQTELLSFSVRGKSQDLFSLLPADFISQYIIQGSDQRARKVSSFVCLQCPLSLCVFRGSCLETTKPVTFIRLKATYGKTQERGGVRAES